MIIADLAEIAGRIYPARRRTQNLVGGASPIQALAFISADDALLSRFVSLTGCGLDEVRGRITEPGFLGAVLDFLLGDEAAVVAFAAATISSRLAPGRP